MVHLVTNCLVCQIVSRYLEEDIREQNNVADRYPEIVIEMEHIMDKERTSPELDLFRLQALGDSANDQYSNQVNQKVGARN